MTLGVISITTALAACAGPTSSATPGGQSAAAAQREIESISGVEAVSIHVSKTLSGFNAHYTIDTDVTLDDSSTIPDPAKLIDQLVAVSWSVNEKSPDNGVSLTLKTTPLVAVGPIAEQAGWSDVSYATKSANPEAQQNALFPAPSMTKKLGAWPGPVPKVSGDLVETDR
jgi:hypothetical protein